MHKHTPVLFNEVIEAMPVDAQYIFDGTLGHAGHTVGMAQALLKQGKSNFHIVWADKDAAMIEKARHSLEEGRIPAQYVTIVQRSYAELEAITQESGVESFDYILLDIGVNMDHFKEAARGFSIKRDGALDMRFDTRSGETVATWLNKATYQTLYDAFALYADFSDKYNDRISKELVVRKKKHPFVTTQDVRDWAKENSINDKKLAIIFQTRRIIINDELGQLDHFLQTFTTFLQPGWICAILSYHSWEDRRVKTIFKELHMQWKWVNLTKKVITPHWEEVKRNKAARSAKMRLFQVHHNKP